MNPSTHPYLAIVGSRSYPALDQVRAFASAAALRGYIVVSGGAKGVDTAAEDAARSKVSTVIVCKPGRPAELDPFAHLHARNQVIVDVCSALVAFTERENGGTWDTIRRAQAAGKLVATYHPNTFPLKPLVYGGRFFSAVVIDLASRTAS